MCIQKSAHFVYDHAFVFWMCEFQHAVTPSPIVTHSPAVMVRGVNVAAAVAIPVLLVLLLLVIGVVVGATLLIRSMFMLH